MVINAASTSITFYPFVDFTGYTNVRVEVIHKTTKEMDASTEAITKTNSKVEVNLPTLTNVTAVAENLNMVLLRVLDISGADPVLLWEYLATWSDASTDINNDFKEWQTTPTQTDKWVTPS